MVNYDLSRVAIDAVLLTVHENKLKVFLHTREKDPFSGQLELPGRLLRHDETAEQALQKVVHTEFPKLKTYFTQFHTFTDPSRDPRIRTVSIGFVSLIPEDKFDNIVYWHDLNMLRKIAFDHKKIVLSALSYLKDNISPQLLKHFLPVTFPLNKLQLLYELIEGRRYDNRNFRKKILSMDILEESGVETGVSHRPAKLYQFK